MLSSYPLPDLCIFFDIGVNDKVLMERFSNFLFNLAASWVIWDMVLSLWFVNTQKQPSRVSQQ